jgi:aminoglycoside phosphotransferase family enzyme
VQPLPSTHPECTLDVPRETLPFEGAPSFEARLGFLRTAAAHASLGAPPEELETHMSWLFFVGERVLKLKKPVHFAYLDFTTLAAREHNCREEVRLNSRLAPGVYLGLIALREDQGHLALVDEAHLNAPGRTVDWLVAMQRLPRERSLNVLLADHAVGVAEVNALAERMVGFYRRALTLRIEPHAYVERFRQEQRLNRQVLATAAVRWPQPASVLDRYDAMLERWAPLLLERARHRRIVEGHGDLRPEHVWLMSPAPVVIDALEFSAPLRQLDPFDELAYFALECALIGAAWVGDRLIVRCTAALGDTLPSALLPLYTAHRALIRARLSMAHLQDEHPRTPERWPQRAAQYLERALAAIELLEALAHANAFTTARRSCSP